VAASPLPSPLSPPGATRADFLRDALALEAVEIVPMHGDPALAEKNVAAGVASVLAYDAHVAQHLPQVDLRELRSLPDLARVVVEATREADEGHEETQALVEEGLSLRRRLRAAATALVVSEVLAPRDLAKLGNDRGSVDVGAECAALASLFQRRAEDIAGASPCSEADVSRAAEIGSALRARWKPTGAGRKAGADGLRPVDARDRLWTLLVLRHERLWAVGAYVYGHVVDEHVPALHAPAPPAPRKSKARG
jgi:hypothetical protein